MDTTETILITGGTGFIGSWTALSLLDRGHDVVAYDISTDTTVLEEVGIAEDVTVREGDITDTNDVLTAVDETGATRIIHLAALLTHACRTNPKVAIDVNITGTLNILEAARQRDTVERVAWASTSGVYAPPDRYDDEWITEDALLDPGTLYGATKAYCEKQARVYAEEHDVSSVALRLATVYGPYKEISGDPSKSASAVISGVFVDPALGHPYSTDVGDHPLNWVYVKDIAQAFTKASLVADDNLRRREYNIAGDQYYSLREVANVVDTYIDDATFDITGDRTMPWMQGMTNTAAREDFDFNPEYDIETATEEYLNVIRAYNDLDPVS